MWPIEETAMKQPAQLQRKSQNICSSVMPPAKTASLACCSRLGTSYSGATIFSDVTASVKEILS